MTQYIPIHNDLRKPFMEELIKLAEQDEAVCFITCDVGFSFVEQFKEKFPARFFNFGVTEASSMIIAAAMALSGLRPYIYSMINFVTFRVHEMVRNAVCMHNANVKILGVKGSEKYKFLGFSHNLLSEYEDIESFQTLIKQDRLKYYLPKTEEEVKSAILESYQSQKPSYIRL